MVETKTHPSHPASMADRIDKRLRNSGGDGADTTVKTGEGPTRVFHNLHSSGSAKRHGSPNPGESSISGQKRDTV
jgi:hypothetical protein